MKIGKLDNKLLEEIIFGSLTKNVKHDCVIKHSQIGEDCSVLRLKENFCVLSTDPITFTEQNIGQLLVNVNLNDLLTSGAKPIGLMLTIFLPPQTKLDKLKNMMEEIVLSANKFNLEILGGHTEITDAVNRIIVSATIIGQTNKIIDEKILPSDKILMTKWAGIEATIIIAKMYDKYLRNKFGNEFVDECLSFEKYLSVEKEALICQKYSVKKLHDVTEGGIFGALGEIFYNTNYGMKIFSQEISVLEQTKILCDEFLLDPFKIISSGALIIFVDNEKDLIRELNDAKINVKIIGEAIHENKICLQDNSPLIFSSIDQIYKLRENNND